MLETIFGSVLTAGITAASFTVCLIAALALGALWCALYLRGGVWPLLLLGALLLLLSAPLLELMGCPENVLAGAKLYLNIYAVGLPASLI